MISYRRQVENTKAAVRKKIKPFLREWFEDDILTANFGYKREGKQLVNLVAQMIMDDKLPPMRAPVTIKFLSFRDQPGPAGVEDVEIQVERRAYRVRVEGGGWKWQIAAVDSLSRRGDTQVYRDQEILDLIANDMSDIEITDNFTEEKPV